MRQHLRLAADAALQMLVHLDTHRHNNPARKVGALWRAMRKVNARQFRGTHGDGRDAAAEVAVAVVHVAVVCVATVHGTVPGVSATGAITWRSEGKRPIVVDGRDAAPCRVAGGGPRVTQFCTSALRDEGRHDWSTTQGWTCRAMRDVDAGAGHASHGRTRTSRAISSGAAAARGQKPSLVEMPRRAGSHAAVRSAAEWAPRGTHSRTSAPHGEARQESSTTQS